VNAPAVSAGNLPILRQGKMAVTEGIWSSDLTIDWQASCSPDCVVTGQVMHQGTVTSSVNYEAVPVG